jgi:hypothetical protein
MVITIIAGRVTLVGEGGVCVQGFGGGNLREGGHFERPRRRWEDNIRMNLQRHGIGRHGLDLSGSG